MPDALVRIRDFCGKYDSDADPGLLCCAVAQDTWAATPRHLLLVGVEDGQAVGHLLATIEEYYGNRVVMVAQLERDRNIGTLSDELYAEGIQQVVDWGKALGAVGLRVWARTDRVAKLFARRLGFKPSPRVLMNLTFGGE